MPACNIQNSRFGSGGGRATAASPSSCPQIRRHTLGTSPRWHGVTSSLSGKSAPGGARLGGGGHSGAGRGKTSCRARGIRLARMRAMPPEQRASRTVPYPIRALRELGDLARRGGGRLWGAGRHFLHIVAPTQRHQVGWTSIASSALAPGWRQSGSSRPSSPVCSAELYRDSASAATAPPPKLVPSPSAYHEGRL